jgi:prevent-host-death family protein
MARWQLQEAKAKLSDLVKATERDGPQEITVRGKITAVVLSRAAYERLMGRRGSLVEFMRKSPFVGVDLKLERDRAPARDVNL